MERKLPQLVLALFVYQETMSFNIRNEQLGKCLQLEGSGSGSRVSLAECSPGSDPQEWQWHPDTLAISSLLTGECLSALLVREHESVRLQSCGSSGAEREGRTWSCSKKGHLTLHGNGLHLSAQHSSTKVFLSKERGRGSKWRTLNNRSVCDPHRQRWHGVTPVVGQLSSPANIDVFRQKSLTLTATQESVSESEMDFITEPPKDSDVSFFSLEYGMTWKVTMLVLSSLALVLGVVILLLNIHNNRKKKVVCVLRSVIQTEAASQQGSPVPSDRAPLTRHPARVTHSPPLQRGEILIEWKDGTVTPLFDNSNYFD